VLASLCGVLRVTALAGSSAEFEKFIAAMTALTGFGRSVFGT
jgi:hypothetical protein